MVCSFVDGFQHFGGLATTIMTFLKDPVMLIFIPFLG